MISEEIPMVFIICVTAVIIMGQVTSCAKDTGYLRTEERVVKEIDEPAE